MDFGEFEKILRLLTQFPQSLFMIALSNNPDSYRPGKNLQQLVDFDLVNKIRSSGAYVFERAMLFARQHAQGRRYALMKRQVDLDAELGIAEQEEGLYVVQDENNADILVKVTSILKNINLMKALYQLTGQADEPPPTKVTFSIAVTIIPTVAVLVTMISEIMQTYYASQTSGKSTTTYITHYNNSTVNIYVHDFTEIDEALRQALPEDTNFIGSQP